jgi:hypothetical protein
MCHNSMMHSIIAVWIHISTLQENIIPVKVQLIRTRLRIMPIEFKRTETRYRNLSLAWWYSWQKRNILIKIFGIIRINRLQVTSYGRSIIQLFKCVCACVRVCQSSHQNITLSILSPFPPHLPPIRVPCMYVYI